MEVRTYGIVIMESEEEEEEEEEGDPNPKVEQCQNEENTIRI